MYFFIPSWYGSEQLWGSPYPVWYRQQQSIEFDDLLNQMHLFHRNQLPTTLVTLSYTPHLRTMMHNQLLASIPSVSLFDLIQAVELDHSRPIDYLQFDWPIDVSFVYTPFETVAYQQNRLYAKIFQGNAGNVLWLDRYEEEQLTRRLYFDDRGFLSSIIFFRHNEPIEQHYLSLSGHWVIKHQLDTDGVYVNPLYQERFNEQYYVSMAALIREVFANWVEQQDPSDRYFIGSHQQHNDLLFDLLASEQIILSFYPKRLALQDWQSLKEKASLPLILVDSQATERVVVEQLGEHINYMQITPYDTKLQLGNSTYYRESYILVLVDQLDSNQLTQVLDQFRHYLSPQSTARLIMIDFGAPYIAKAEIEKELAVIQEELASQIEISDEDLLEMANMDDDEMLFVEYMSIRSEIELAELMEKVRIVVDVAPTPNLYLQMAAISAGVPQINRVATHYVQDKANGRIIEEIGELSEVLDYYLLDLSHWNKALVHSVKAIQASTSEQLVQKIVSRIEG